MKKTLIVLLIIFSMFTVGCRDMSLGDTSNLNKDEQNQGNDIENNSQKDEANDEEQGKKDDEVIVSPHDIKEFIGINPNEKYNYAGENSEFAEYFTYVEYIDGDKYQIRTNNSATETVTVIEATDSELRVVFKRGVCDYRENFLNKPLKESETLLKEPISVGTEWMLSDGSKRYISSIDTKISTDMGEFQCIEVTTINKNGQKDLQYYAPSLGLVKEIWDTENMAVASTLSSIEKDVKLTQVLRFYYPDEGANYMKYEDVSISFDTNDITRVTLENKFREYGILKDNVGINSLYLNDDGMVYLDITNNFIKEMANGTTGEFFAIYDLVNTIGRYYGVDKVYMTLDGSNYESGHIIKYKGESFTVDLSRVQ